MNPMSKNPDQKKVSALRQLWRIILYGFLLGVAINLPFFGSDLYHYMSRASTFDKLQIGMPLHEVDAILRADGIWCSVAASGSSDDCRFSDFWRNYSVVADPNFHVVRAKFYQFKLRPFILDRVLRRKSVDFD
jgi:hypothetical protein